MNTLHYFVTGLVDVMLMSQFAMFIYVSYVQLEEVNLCIKRILETRRLSVMAAKYQVMAE